MSTTQETLERIAGSPDYAIVVCVWPWPDGGWKAGCVLIDQQYAEDQGLKIGNLKELSFDECSWDMFDGFHNGLNTTGSTLNDALNELWTRLCEET